MIINKNLTTNKGWNKKFKGRNQHQQTDNNNYYNIKNENNKYKDNSISQIIWFNIFCYIKYESSLEYKSIYNCAMLYFTALIIISPKILEDLRKN